MSIDVRCLPYMPLHIERLRRSKAWLRCKRRPELAFYLMNLWMRAWHEVPAGSIEADDDVLADAAMCSPDEWERIKGDVLQGWEERGGRWHHHVVTELAADGLQKVEASRKRTEAARQARLQNRTASVTGDVTINATDTVADTKEKKKGREEDSDADASDAHEPMPALEAVSIPPSGGMAAASKSGLDSRGFDRFWQRYPHRVGKQDAMKAFLAVGRRGGVTMDAMMAGLERYIRTKPPDRAWCNPGTWLRQGRWEDEPSVGVDFGGQGRTHPRRPSGAGAYVAAMGEELAERVDAGPSAPHPRPIRADEGSAQGGAGNVLPLGRAFGAGFG